MFNSRESNEYTSLKYENEFLVQRAEKYMLTNALGQITNLVKFTQNYKSLR